MHQTTVFIKGITILGMLVMTIWLAQTAFAEGRISANINATPSVKLNDDERRALSMAAGRLLMHVDAARQAITKKDKQVALDNLKKGLTLGRIIRNAEPEYRVNANIESGGLVYKDEQTVKPAIIPIYRELDQLSLEEPIRSTTRRAAKNTNIVGAPVVADVESLRSQIRLDVSMANEQMVAAKIAVEKDKFKEADQALAAFQDSGVIFEFDVMNLPLVRARENLMLAKTMIEEDNPKDARVELQAAADALDKYRSMVGDQRAGELRSMREEISALTQEVEKDQGGAVKKITALWDRLIKWF